MMKAKTISARNIYLYTCSHRSAFSGCAALNHAFAFSYLIQRPSHSIICFQLNNTCLPEASCRTHLGGTRPLRHPRRAALGGCGGGDHARSRCAQILSMPLGTCISGGNGRMHRSHQISAFHAGCGLQEAGAGRGVLSHEAPLHLLIKHHHRHRHHYNHHHQSS